MAPKTYVYQQNQLKLRQQKNHCQIRYSTLKKKVSIPSTSSTSHREDFVITVEIPQTEWSDYWYYYPNGRQKCTQLG